MLQNEKYIEFANDNTVEVLAFQELQKGIDRGDPRVTTYDAKDENGNPVKYMKPWPGLTAEEVIKLHQSPAGQYNDTKGIPFTAIIDPHTLKRMTGLSGGQSVKGLIEKIEVAKKQLNTEHGPSVKRSTLKRVEQGVKEIGETLEKGGPAKAFEQLKKLKGSIAKEPEAIQGKVAELEAKLLDAARTKLDEAEAQISTGDVKTAKATLGPLAGALKGTELEARAKELLEKTKPAEPAK